MKIQRSILKLSNMLRYQFLTANRTDKVKSGTGIFTANKNLHFEDQNYHLYMSPLYPQLTEQGSNTYKINSQSIVLYFKFISKLLANEQIDQQKIEDLSFSFKFTHLQSLLEVEPNSGAQTMIIRSKTENATKIFQGLKVMDQPSKLQVLFQIRKSTVPIVSQKQQNPPTLKFNLSYLQYRVMHILLKKSLYDLSGMHLIQQIKRLQEVGQLENDVLSQVRQIKRQVKQFYD